MKLIVVSIGGLGLAAMLVACQAATPAPAPSSPSSSSSRTVPSTSASSTTAASTPTSPSAQSTLAVQNAICAAVPQAPVPGGHCRATNVKVSAADPDWVYARVGIYSAQGQLMSD